MLHVHAKIWSMKITFKQITFNPHNKEKKETHKYTHTNTQTLNNLILLEVKVK
jgi:hypothetical protein